MWRAGSLRDLLSTNRLMNRHEFGAVGERPFDLNLRDHRRHSVHHRIGRENRGAEAHDLGDRKNQELVDFSRRQMHGGFLRGRIIPQRDVLPADRQAYRCCAIILAMSTRYGWIGLGLVLFAMAACSSEPPKPAPVTAAAAPAPPPEPRVKVYVTNEASGDLTVIDGDRQTAIGTFPLGKRPRGIKVSPDGASLFVALSGSPNAGPGVDPKSLPPPDRNADGIGEIDAATYKVKRIIHAGNDPEQLAVSADGTKLYVANEDAAQVSVVDVATGKVVGTVKTGDEPEGVTIRPDGKVVYITSEDEGAVYAIDTGTNKVLKKVPVGHRPRSIGFLPDGSRAFVSLENDGAIAVVDAKAHKFLHLLQLEGKGATP